jgi:hypothetical protein
MVTAGEGGRVNVQISWGKLLTGLVVVVGTIAGGYWLLIDKMVGGLRESVATLNADTGQRFKESGDEARDIRRVLSDAKVLLTAEMQASRAEFGNRIDKVGDRIVAANQEVGKQIGLLRVELTASMDKRDGAVQQRFDRIEQKLDSLLGRILYEKVSPDPAVPFMVDTDKKDMLLNRSGEAFGNPPLVIRVYPPTEKPNP